MNPFVRPRIIADRREKDDNIGLAMSSSFELVDDNGVTNNRRAEDEAREEWTTGEYAPTKAIVMRKRRCAETK